MMLDCSLCAWIAALLSCLSFGTFAVPIKSPAAKSVNVDPLVFQSYKTFMCFVTSWIVLLFGEPFIFTPWGIVSGLFWVPAGVAAIYAVKNAGLAVSQGLWSSIIVLVSFTWGIFIFDEEVKSVPIASFAIFLMIIGLWGMSFFSAEETTEDVVDEEAAQNITKPVGFETKRSGYRPFESLSWDKSDGTEIYSTTEAETETTSQIDKDLSVGGSQTSQEDGTEMNIESVKSDSNLLSLEMTDNDYHSSSSDSNVPEVHPTYQLKDDLHTRNVFYSLNCEKGPSRRHMGLAAAVFNGLWGGSVMVPMHYAPDNIGGARFVISFAIGASLITVLLWIIRYILLLRKFNMSHSQAYYHLPSLHIKVMWIPGGIAGTLWSLGNFCSMISVQNLGEGVGYSLTQASMLVSGLWGIFYFREVQGKTTIIKWLLSAFITLIGILILSSQV